MRKKEKTLRDVSIDAEDEPYKGYPDLEPDDEAAEIEDVNKEKPRFSIPWSGLILIGVIVVLMIICIIVIGVSGGFSTTGSNTNV